MACKCQSAAADLPNAPCQLASGAGMAPPYVTAPHDASRQDDENVLDLQSEVIAFLDEFVDLFRTFDGPELMRLYRSPYAGLQEDGSIQLCATAPETASYFQDVLDEYLARGCRSCRYEDLVVVPLGTQSALASLTWALCLESGIVMNSWRESYLLTRTDGALRVFASVDHAS